MADNSINVIVVPETEDFSHHVSHENVVWINKNLGTPKLKERNVKYVAPFWLSEENKGVDRIYHIKEVRNGNELVLGNSFVLSEIWSAMGNHRKFEYHPLESFNFVEISDGLLIPYIF